MSIDVSNMWRYFWRYISSFLVWRRRMSLTALRIKEIKPSKKDQKLSDGVDPNEQKKARKRNEEAPTFEEIVLRWWQQEQGQWTGGDAKSVIKRLPDNSFYGLRNLRADKVTPLQVIDVIKKIEESDKRLRLLQIISSI